jgi:choice-of-anchor A domain-containing protein
MKALLLLVATGLTLSACSKNFEVEVTATGKKLTQGIQVEGPPAEETEIVYNNPSVPGEMSQKVCAVNDFGIFEFGADKLSLSGSALIKTSLALGPGSQGQISGSAVINKLYKDPSATLNTSGAIRVGSTVSADLGKESADLVKLSSEAGALTMTQNLGDFVQSGASSVRLESAGGLNVISVRDFRITGSHVLRLKGGEKETFVFNVWGDFKISGSLVMKLEGGIKPANVLFNVIGEGGEAAISGSSLFVGTVLVPQRKFSLSGSALLRGAVMGGREISISGSSAALEHVSFCSAVVSKAKDGAAPGTPGGSTPPAGGVSSPSVPGSDPATGGPMMGGGDPMVGA